MDELGPNRPYLLSLVGRYPTLLATVQVLASTCTYVYQKTARYFPNTFLLGTRGPGGGGGGEMCAHRSTSRLCGLQTALKDCRLHCILQLSVSGLHAYQLH